MMPPSGSFAVGLAYILVGSAGLVLNLVTVVMILTRRVYRLSAYSIMGNVALADAVMMAVTGVFCGVAILLKSVDERGSAGMEAPIPSYNLTAATTATRSQQWDAGNAQMEASRFGWDSDDSKLESRVKKRETVRLYEAGMGEWLQLGDPQRSSHVTRKTHSHLHRKALHNAPQQPKHWLAFVPSLVETSAWTAGVLSYAVLGLNRCVAICFYSTKAKTFNRVSVAASTSVACWLMAFALAAVGTFPSPLVGLRLDMWSTSLLPTASASSPTGAASGRLVLVHFISAATQWTCSTLVLLKIRQVKRKILKNQLNQNSANRFRKQARLTFQFLYPSLFGTLTSLLYFVKPLVWHRLGDAYLITLHMLWLANHLCNPFIYAYFNERMRATYREMLTCSRLRSWVSRNGKWRFSGRADMRRQASSRYPQASRRSARFSLKSGGRPANGNFVRSSLQLQSRDFEQLCEFMMRVNPLNMSSEGWRESSEWQPADAAEAVETECAQTGGTAPNRLLGTKSEALLSHSHGGDSHRSSFRSIVLDLGLPTVEGLARFAKKSSI